MSRSYTDKELEKIYKDWQNSGLSQNRYCDANGLKKSLFKSELYKLRKRRRTNGLEIRGFNLVKLPEKVKEKPKEAYCEIRFTGGRRVTFSDKESLLGLKSLISDLIHE